MRFKSLFSFFGLTSISRSDFHCVWNRNYSSSDEEVAWKKCWCIFNIFGRHALTWCSVSHNFFEMVLPINHRSVEGWSATEFPLYILYFRFFCDLFDLLNGWDGFTLGIEISSTCCCLIENLIIHRSGFFHH